MLNADQDAEQQIDESLEDGDSDALPGLDDPDDGGLPGLDDAATATESQEDSNFSSSDPSAEDSADTSAAVPVVDTCVSRRAEQIVLDFHSPDFSDGVTPPGIVVEIPRLFTASGEGGNQEGLTPSFVWSEVPPETTEIAIFIGTAPEEPWETYRDTENIYGQLIPLASEWMLAGLAPSTTSLAQTSHSIAPPEGSIELGDPFVGASFPESRFVFGVVALCNRDVDSASGIGSLKSDAIAVGQFLASPVW